MHFTTNLPWSQMAWSQKSYLIQQCRNNLNKLCRIDPLSGKLPGSKVHSLRDTIKDHILDYIKENPNFDPAKENIQIKISIVTGRE